MKKEIKIEELNAMELLKLIYTEVKKDSEKIDKVYRELDEKIDNTKNTLVKEISEELKNFYQINQDLTNNLNKKLEDEIEDRKVEVSKIKEFNRIIINDVRSRVSILEEESEKYNLK